MNITQLVTGPLSVNTWCIPLDSRRIIVVDPGGDADIIIAHIAEQNSTLAAILLTHGHFDHMTALPTLNRAFPGVPIAIHPDDALFLGTGALARHYSYFAALGMGQFMQPYTEELPPATTFLADGESVTIPRLDGLKAGIDMYADGNNACRETIPGWKVLHTPGHSPGSVCFYNESEGILLSGDTLFNSGCGRTDGAGGSFEALMRSLGRLFELPRETLVLPGHGPRTSIGRESGM